MQQAIQEKPETPSAQKLSIAILACNEAATIRRVLASTKSLDEAASVLEIDLATLWRRRKKYGI